MLKEKTAIGPGLMFTLLFSSIFGFGVMNSPYVATNYMGGNGYLGFAVAFLLVIPVISAAVWLGNRFPDKSLVGYLPDIFGKIPAKLLSIIYLLFLVIILSWSLRLMGELFNVYFLFRTPLWVTVGIILLSITYIAHSGIEGITRLAAFVFPLAVIFITLSTAISYQNFDFDHVQPVFYFGGKNYLFGILQIFYVFFPLATVFMIYPYLTEKQKGYKTVISATGIAFVFIFLIIFASIGTYGGQGVLRYSWATLEMIRNTNVPIILQTFGLFFAITWLSQILIAASGFYYTLAQATCETFNFLNYKWVVLFLFPIILTITLIPPSIIDIRFYSDYVRTIGFFLIFLVPVITWVAAFLRKRGEVTGVS